MSEELCGQCLALMHDGDCIPPATVRFLRRRSGWSRWTEDQDLHVELDEPWNHRHPARNAYDDCLSQGTRSAKPRSHPKLVRAYRELASDKRVSRPRLSGSSQQGAWARVDCV